MTSAAFHLTVRSAAKAPVLMVIGREYVATQTVIEAIIPIISEDICGKIAGNNIFDNEDLSA